MKVAITGGGGFIGSNLTVYLLDRGISVGIITRKNPLPENISLSHPNLRIINKSCDDPEIVSELSQYDLLIHLASTTVPENSTRNPQFDVESNTLAGLRLLKNCKQAGIRKVVFISSGGVVYGNQNKFPIPESAELNPYSSYGITKLMFEKFLVLQKKFEELDYCILRVANVYGPRESNDKNQGVIPVWIQKIRKQEPIQLVGDGEIVRDYIYIDDVCEAFFKVIEKDVSGIYNIGTGLGHSLNDIRNILEKLSGKELKVEHSSVRKFDVSVNILSIEKFKQTTGWTPHWNLFDGIRETWNKMNGLN